jgi:DNA-binding MarR family transcriptional regulator
LDDLDGDLEFAQLLIGLFRRIAAHFNERCQELGLTRSQVHALLALERPCSQRELANALNLDTSNITGIVDRLEAEGLVARSIDPSDRRVRQVARTEAGERVRAEFMGRFLATMPSTIGITDADKDALRSVLSRVVTAEEVEAVRRGAPAAASTHV